MSLAMFKIFGATFLYIIALVVAIGFKMSLEKILTYMAFVLATDLYMSRLALLIVLKTKEIQNDQSRNDE